jgi:hypothetical protein
MIDITDLKNENNRQYENWIKHPIVIWGIYPMSRRGGADIAPFINHIMARRCIANN